MKIVMRLGLCLHITTHVQQHTLIPICNAQNSGMNRKQKKKNRYNTMMIPNRLEVNKGRPLIANSLFSPVLTKKETAATTTTTKSNNKKERKGGRMWVSYNMLTIISHSIIAFLSPSANKSAGVIRETDGIEMDTHRIQQTFETIRSLFSGFIA